MKKRFLFIGSLPTKKFYFDGERNKSKDVLNALKHEYGGTYSVINLSLNKYIQVLKMVFLSFFVRYDFIFLSKCLVGGSRAIKYLLRFANKYNKHKIIFYLIGNGSNGFDNKTIYYDCLKKAKHIIVESPDVEFELISKGITTKEHISIIPCIKPNYEIRFKKKKYPVKCLKLIFFSRVTELKGVMDAIIAVSKINERFKGTLFELDIAGGSGFERNEISFLDQIKKIAEQKKFIRYLGLNLRIEGEESYKRLQYYDLHIFPSKFYQECAPGSVIDMFIAGVPTLSSTFPSAKYIMNENNSLFFEMGNIEDLEKKLLFVYNNQTILNKMRENASRNAELYNEKHFLEEVGKIIERTNE